MHYTSPAHPQEKKQEYQIDFLQRLVIFNLFQHYLGARYDKPNGCDIVLLLCISLKVG